MEDPVKEYFFRFIDKNKQSFQNLLEQQNYSELIKLVLEGCYDKIIAMDDNDEAIATLATGLLHYLLTNALIPSQRKVKYRGMEIDIVIPDLKTLEKDPKKTLVISIQKTSNKNEIEKKIIELERIQPDKQNIWLLLPQNIPVEKKKFVISKKDESFANIIYEIGRFVNINNQNKFKILRT